MLAEKLGIFVSIDWNTMFEDHLSANGRSERTIQAYMQDVRSFASWFEAENGQVFEPTLINGVDLRGWRRHSLTIEKVSPSTWNRRLASLRVLVRWAYDTEAISYDPMDGVDRAAEVELAPRWLDHQQLVKLLRQCEINVNGAASSTWRFMALRDQAMIYLMAYAGLREAEVAGLDLADVELNERSGKVIVRLGKGQKRREVPLAKEARRALRLWLDYRCAAGSAIFTGSSKGERISARTIQRRVAEVGRQVGLVVTPHDLRHTFAKRTLDEGAPLTVVSKLLGHARLDTTARYVVPGWGDLEKAVEKI